MEWLSGAVVAGLVVILTWGLLAPRGLWRATVGWTVSDPQKREPGSSAYLLRRVLSGIGLIAVAAVVVPSALSAWLPSGQTAAPATQVEQRWGSPEPLLVERQYDALGDAPAGLASMPVLAYQDVEVVGDGAYLGDLRSFSLLGETDLPGYLGTEPAPDYSVPARTYLVVKVRGPLLCIPREVVVRETEETVEVGVFYGLPDPDLEIEGAVAPDHIAGCPADAAVTTSVLVPIVLGSGVGERTVVDLEGNEIPAAPTP